MLRFHLFRVISTFISFLIVMIVSSYNKSLNHVVSTASLVMYALTLEKQYALIQQICISGHQHQQQKRKIIINKYCSGRSYFCSSIIDNGFSLCLPLANVFYLLLLDRENMSMLSQVSLRLSGLCLF